MAKLPKLKDVENARNLLLSKLGAREIGKRLGISFHTVDNWANRMRKGTLDAYLEKIRAIEQGAETAQEPSPKSNRKSERNKFRSQIQKLRAQGLTYRKIAERLGLRPSAVWYWMSTSPKSRKGLGINGHRQSHKTKITPKMIAKGRKLRERGFTWDKIADEIGLHKSTVYAHKDEFLGTPEGDSHIGEHTNGHVSNTTTANVDKNIFVGWAYAKVSDFIDHLAERSPVSQEILRSRLAELLGHSEIR